MIRAAAYGLRLRAESLEVYLAEAREHPSGRAFSAAAFHAGALRARADRALNEAREAYPRLRRVK